MNEKGLTLVEVLITTLIMTVIMGSIMMALSQGNSQVAYELRRDELDSTMTAILERLELVLKNAKYEPPFGETEAVSGDGTWVAFRVPVVDDFDDDGNVDAVDSNFNRVWGVIKGLGTIPSVRTDEDPPRALFKQELDLLELTLPQIPQGVGIIKWESNGTGLSEPDLKVNINANTEAPGDTDDEFDFGELFFTSDDDNDGNEDWRIQLGGGFILQPRDNWGGDIDGDGTPDPIFRRPPGEDYLEVRLFMGRAPAGVPPILVGRSIRIYLRNN